MTEYHMQGFYISNLFPFLLFIFNTQTPDEHNTVATIFVIGVTHSLFQNTLYKLSPHLDFVQGSKSEIVTHKGRHEFSLKPELPLSISHLYLSHCLKS